MNKENQRQHAEQAILDELYPKKRSLNIFVGFRDHAEERYQRHHRNVVLSAVGVILLVAFFLLVVGMAYAFAGMKSAWADEEIATAIYKAEGARKAAYAYGIRSVRYESKKEAKKICLNTIRKNKVRFTKQNKYDDFIEFLGSRYCPVKGRLSKAENRLNRYWVKNVKYHLEKTAKRR